MLFDALPPEIVRLVLRSVPPEYLISARVCSRTLYGLVAEDPQWLPVVAPPALAHTTLSLHEHGALLIRLFVRYLHWRRRWLRLEYEDNDDELLKQNTALDGFFALSPWLRLEGERAEGAWVPVTWLQRMVYGEAPAAPEVIVNEHGVFGARRSRRLQPRTPDEKMSKFYQQRERDDDDAFRTFYSVPVTANWRRERPPARKIVLQPLSVRRPDGSAHPNLPELSDEMLAALETAAEVLRCYLPPIASSTGVGQERVNPFAPTKLLECAASKYVSRDLQKEFDNEGQPIYQLRDDAIYEEAPAGFHSELETTTFTTYIIAPHLRPAGSRSLAWCFSSPICRHCAWHDLVRRAQKEGEAEPGPIPWCISTFQIEKYLDHSEALRTRVLTSMVAYCVLGEGIGLDTCCENSPCVMNNCDSVGEAAATSLLLCPCCLRKLQLNGCLTDVPACLDALREVLSGDALRSVSQRDLDTLREWGH